MAEYIERETLIKHVLSRLGISGPESLLPQEKAVVEYISDCPAADVKPVVHGEWKEHFCDDNTFWSSYCSRCQVYLPYGMDWKPNFCPVCGADMGGAKNGYNPEQESCNDKERS